MLRPLSDLRVGDRVKATIKRYEPWGVIAKIQEVEPVGASLDMIARQHEPGVQALAQRRPPIGTTIGFVVAELRSWHQEPWVWVRLAVPDPFEIDRSPSPHQ